MKKVLVCKPNGFCAGVDRAIKIVELALDAYGAPIYVNHEIVHNHHVVDALAAKGAVFVNDALDEVPHGARLIYSAHGVSPVLREQARARHLIELDATCPLVTKVHMEAVRYARKGYHIFLIGHAEHVEVVGTYGEAPESITVVEPLRGDALKRYIDDMPEPPSDKLLYLTQTTLNADDCLSVAAALKHRFPTLEAPPSDDICYATTNRQDAVKAVAAHADFVIVVGAHISSNSKRLVEVAEEAGCPAGLYGDVTAVRAQLEDDLQGYQTIGVTAGASTPDPLIQGVIGFLVDKGFGDVQEFFHVREDMHFNLPYQLREDLKARGMAV